jgi:hypothetical protein
LVVGASAGTVDQKIHRKWVWAYIEAMAELVNMAESLLFFLHLIIDFIINGNSVQRTPPMVDAIAIRRTPSPSIVIICSHLLTLLPSQLPLSPHRRSTLTVKKRGMSSTTVL